MLKLLDLLECLKYSYESTGNIADRTGQNWATIYGNLCALESKGLIERQEIQLKKGQIMSIWRRRKETATAASLAKLGRRDMLTIDEVDMLLKLIHELNPTNPDNKKDEITEEAIQS